MTKPPNQGKLTWADVMAPHIRRFELAAMFGSNATYNAKGAASMAKLLKKMARIIDEEVEHRVVKKND